jgi:predicted dehydrogenase
MVKNSTSRRQFLKRATGVSAASLGLPYIVSSAALGLNGSIAPSNRIVMGCIGVGSQGTANMNAFMSYPDVQVVAVCDVERGRAAYRGATFGREQAKQMVEDYYTNKTRSARYKGCEEYKDFRKLLARSDIDAVTVSTPDHWHALISIAAAKADKDIYCEKPLANTVLEGREVCDAVERYGRVLQTGSQERSNDNVRFACELIHNGRIGRLETIQINMPCSDPHHQEVVNNTGPHPEMPIPDGFDYDMWLGPTSEEPYTEMRCHFWWRFIMNYGGGEITDRGADIIDLAQLGNDTDDTGPVEITAKGKRLPKGLFDVFMEYEFEFKYANRVRMIGKNTGTRGLKFEGEDGWIFIHIPGGLLEAEPESLLKEEIGFNEIHLARSPGHHRDFLDAVKSRGEPVAPAEVGHRTATICHLTNIALLTERKLKWNPRMERITNSYEADLMLSRPIRSPWYL